MPFYYDTGSGLTEAPIVLESTSISGTVFVGNIALAITATTLNSDTSGSSFPPQDASLNYWDTDFGVWRAMSGTGGAMNVNLVNSSQVNPIIVSGTVTATPTPGLNNSRSGYFTASIGAHQIADPLPDRKQLTIYNDSDSDMYIMLGVDPASTSSFTLKLQPAAYFELPAENGIYVGPVSVVWKHPAVGQGVVTEFWI